MFENCSIPWTVTYDEIIYGIDGELEIHTDEGRHRIGPGDIMWLPAGTRLTYVAREPARFFFAVASGDRVESGKQHPSPRPRASGSPGLTPGHAGDRLPEERSFERLVQHPGGTSSGVCLGR